MFIRREKNVRNFVNRLSFMIQKEKKGKKTRRNRRKKGEKIVEKKKDSKKHMPKDLVGQWNVDRLCVASSCLIKCAKKRTIWGHVRDVFGIFMAVVVDFHLLTVACYLMSCTRTQKATFGHIMCIHLRSMNEQSVQQVHASQPSDAQNEKKNHSLVLTTSQ